MPAEQQADKKPWRGRVFAGKFATASQPFVYRPLTAPQGRKEIRLLKLFAHSGRENGVLKGTLDHVSLVDEPDYETLSYAWGHSSARKKILLDNRVLLVPASAVSALHRMRLKGEDRVLWIDSVCINQADTAERNAQVAAMADIYSKGRRNLVWLGHISTKSTAFMQSFYKIMKNIGDETDNYERLEEVVFDESRGFRLSGSGLPDDIDLRPVMKVFGSAWFRRLWVAQEAMLARCSSCSCGLDLELPLENLLTVAM